MRFLPESETDTVASKESFAKLLRGLKKADEGRAATA